MSNVPYWETERIQETKESTWTDILQILGNEDADLESVTELGKKYFYGFVRVNLLLKLSSKMTYARAYTGRRFIHYQNLRSFPFPSYGSIYNQ